MSKEAVEDEAEASTEVVSAESIATGAPAMENCSASSSPPAAPGFSFSAALRGSTETEDRPPACAPTSPFNGVGRVADGLVVAAGAVVTAAVAATAQGRDCAPRERTGASLAAKGLNELRLCSLGLVSGNRSTPDLLRARGASSVTGVEEDAEEAAALALAPEPAMDAEEEESGWLSALWIAMAAEDSFLGSLYSASAMAPAWRMPAER